MLSIFFRVFLCGVLTIMLAFSLMDGVYGETKSDDDKNCVSYEPGTVTLTGTLRTGMTTWILELPQPICIEGREKNPISYPAMDEVSTIIFWKGRNNFSSDYKHYIDRQVVVTGTLHHKATDKAPGDIMMMVSHIEVAKQ